MSSQTGQRFSLDEPIWRGPLGELLDIELEAAFPRDRIAARPPSMWRYEEALPPFDGGQRVSYAEGMTPLISEELFGRRVWVKLEQLFPSGSYKDRGASVLISQVRRLGVSSVVEDSSGNAGAAIAMYCAKGGVACEIYAPEATSPAKLAQIRACGARLVLTPGDREATAAAAMQAAERAYYASHVWNPFFFQGTKTFAFEIAEQLGWRAPDVLLVPLGNGSLLMGAFLGFSELKAAGVIDRLPKLVGVQAAACAPVYRAWSGQPDGICANSATIAEGIAIAAPRRMADCLRMVRRTNGQVIRVTEDEIASGLREALSRGLFIEPTAAAVVAAIPQIDDRQAEIVLPLTGHGLKAAEKSAGAARG